MKPFKQILIFLSVWIGLPLIMAISNIPYQNLLLIGIPVLFFLYHFVQSIRFFIEKNFKLSHRSFIISILFFLIAIKIEYHFYNWLIHIILIGLGFYFFKPFDGLKTDKSKFLGLLLLGINISLLITSNGWILNHLNFEKKSWSTDLNWTDFQGLPELDSNKDAIITTSIKYKVNKLYNYPNAVISTFMIPNESWKKEISDEVAQKELLNHEKGHFNIVEANMRFAKDSLHQVWGKSPDRIEEIIEFYIDQKENTQDKYDSETENGSNIKKQREWDELIKTMLN